MGARTRNGGSVMRAAGSLIFTAGLALACTDTTGTAPTYTVGARSRAWRGRGWCSATTTATISSSGPMGRWSLRRRSPVAPRTTSRCSRSRPDPPRAASSPAAAGRWPRPTSRASGSSARPNLHRRGNGLRPGGVGAGTPQQRRRRSPGVGRRRRQPLRRRWPMAPHMGSRCSPSRPVPLRPVRQRRQRDDGPGQCHDRRDRLRDQYLLPSGVLSQAWWVRAWCSATTAGTISRCPPTARSPLRRRWPMRAAYSVTVFKQPTRPAQTCFVIRGSGTMARPNVTTVVIACFTNGAVRVTVSTAGADIPSTYTVYADPGISGSSTAVVPSNGSVSLGLASGATC